MTHRITTAILAIGMILLITAPMLQIPVHAAEPVNSALGEQKILVIPADFTDNQTTVGAAALENRMAFVDSYIRTASYNQTWVSYQVLPEWTKLNGTFQSFAYSLYGCPTLAVDTIRAVQSMVNFSSFRYVLIIHTGYSFTEMRSEYVGSNCASVNPEVVNLAIASLSDQTTVWVHELLHSIGGYVPGHSTDVLRVQDLYDEALVYLPVNSNIYVNDWDIMSCGCGGMTAWTRMELGWIPASEIQTVPATGSTLENLSSLDSSDGGTKVLKIPISEGPLSLVNGSTITAWTYFIVEFRTPTGIDQNLTGGRPVVLVTMINETKYFDWQTGPLVANSSLYFQLGSVPSYPNTPLNLTISVLDEHGNNALVLVTNSNDAPFVESARSVDAALTALGKEQELKPFMGFQLSVSPAEEQATQALSALYRGNLSAANEHAAKASQMISQSVINLTWEYALPFFAIEAATVATVSLYVALRRPPLKFERYYVLWGKRILVAILVLGPLIVGGAAILNAQGFGDVSNGVSAAGNSVLSNGWWELLEGTVFWVVFFGLAGWIVRGAERDVEEEPASEEMNPAGTATQNGQTAQWKTAESCSQTSGPLGIEASRRAKKREGRVSSAR